MTSFNAATFCTKQLRRIAGIFVARGVCLATYKARQRVELVDE